MAGELAKQAVEEGPKYPAAVYAEARPTYPKEWFSKLAELTPNHKLVWDAGTGSGQAAIRVAEQYDQVIATDVSDSLLRQAVPDPKVRYLHTPLSMSEDELVSMLGGEGSVDLVTVATAVHWFDLSSFYSVVNRVLRKPGGVIAVWTYNHYVSPLEDVIKPVFEASRPYWNPRAWLAFDGYKTLPFPFESVGLGSEGNPATLKLERDMSFDGLVSMLRSWSAVYTAKEKGVDLLSSDVVEEITKRWGDTSVIKRVSYPVYMIAGKAKV